MSRADSAAQKIPQGKGRQDEEGLAPQRVAKASFRPLILASAVQCVGYQQARKGESPTGLSSERLLFSARQRAPPVEYLLSPSNYLLAIKVKLSGQIVVVVGEKDGERPAASIPPVN